MSYLLKDSVCLVVLAVSLYIIVRRQEDRKAREWAFGAIGLILGYCLQ